MTYIMEHDAEADRIRFKTNLLLVRHQLDWVGLRRGQSLIDVGCASGEVIREAAWIAAPAAVVGVDGDPAMLEFARAESDRLELNNIRYVHAWVTGLGSIPVADSSFDHAWTRFFLEYLKDPLGSIREMARIVRPGGKVSLIDLDGNCIWHYPLPVEMQCDLDEVIEDLASTGFDPHIGRKLKALAGEAGLVDIRESVEPYHHIIGRPDERTAEAWRRKVAGIKGNYLKLFPNKAHKADFFDAFMKFFMRDDTMTWSLLHLVQGTKPA